VTRPQIAGLIAMSVVTAGLVAFSLTPRQPVQVAYVSAPVEESAEPEVRPCLGADVMAPDGTAVCDSVDLGSSLTPSVDTLADDKGATYDCWRAENDEMKTCTYGSDAADAARVALVGDSHAAMQIPGLLPHLEELNWRLDTYVGYGCQWKNPRPGGCQDAMEQTAAALAANSYDIIVTSGARWIGSNPDRATDAYASAWAEASALGTRIIVIADTPGVSDEALACISRVGFDPKTSQCGTPVEQAFERVDPLRAAAERTPGATLIDMTDLYCTDTLCPSVIGNAIVYRDAAAHVTATYMETVSPYMIERIRVALTT
jgi:hypothetical protein